MTDIENIIVSKVVNTVFLNHLKGGMGETDNRIEHGISFCAEGHITFYDGDKALELTPGSAILLPKSSKYSWKCHKSGLYPQINFLTASCIDNKIEKFDLGSYLFFDGKLHDLQNSLLASSKARTMSVFYDIIDNIVRKSKPGNHILSKAIDYMLDNYADGAISNKILADKSDISEVYFRKLFKEHYGTTPKQYILDLRIKKASKLLLESRYNISEISEQCGFSSVYHFCRAFKNITALTPTEYAKSNKSEEKYM